MSLNRVFRYLGGLVLATILLAIILPLVGIPASKFLPPNLAYSRATGEAYGLVTKKEIQPTGNPFKVGDHVYLVDYEFKAPAPPVRGQTQPGPKMLHQAQIRVDQAVWGDMDHPKKSGIQPGQLLDVNYVPNYPDINGIYKPDLGRGCGPGSNILSGWLLFVLLDLVLGYLLMILVLERFGTTENI
jgi:hypothetical protein